MSLSQWDNDPNLYVFTSLTAGSSHIVTATSRLETILRANRLHFTYVDTATNDGARRVFTMRAKGKKLPLLVKEGQIIGDIAEIEELNEFGELKEAVGKLPPPGEKSIITTPAKLAGPYSNPSTKTGSPAVGASSSSSAKTALPSSGSKADENKPAQSSIQQTIASEAAAKATERKEAETTKASLLASKSGNASKPATTEQEQPASLATSEVAADTTQQKEPETTKATLRESGSGDESMPTESGQEPSASIAESKGLLDSSASVASSGKAESTSAVPTPQSSTELSEAPARLHRGSSLSIASAEEIKDVERAGAIEEEDGEDDLDTQPTAPEPSVPPIKADEQAALDPSSSSERIDEQAEPPVDEALAEPKGANTEDALKDSLHKIEAVRSNENIAKSKSSAGFTKNVAGRKESATEAHDEQATAAAEEEVESSTTEVEDDEESENSGESEDNKASTATAATDNGKATSGREAPTSADAQDAAQMALRPRNAQMKPDPGEAETGEDDEKPQEQSAAAGEEAGKSVGD